MPDLKTIEAHSTLGQILLNHNQWIHLVRTKKGRLTKEELKLRGSLKGWDLSRFEFKLNDLSYINLENTNFTGTKFLACNLTGVNAIGASFRNAFFYHSNLENSCFYKADFTKASLSQSSIEHSFFIKSIFKNVTLVEVETLGTFLLRMETNNPKIRDTIFDCAHVEPPFVTVH